jgi:malic enzyme
LPRRLCLTWQGIVYEGRKDRKGGALSSQKVEFARAPSEAAAAQEAGTDLARVVRLIRPSSLIGAAARGGAFSEEVIRTLVQASILFPGLCKQQILSSHIFL